MNKVRNNHFMFRNRWSVTHMLSPGARTLNTWAYFVLPEGGDRLWTMEGPDWLGGPEHPAPPSPHPPETSRTDGPHGLTCPQWLQDAGLTRLTSVQGGLCAQSAASLSLQSGCEWKGWFQRVCVNECVCVALNWSGSCGAALEERKINTITPPPPPSPAAVFQVELVHGAQWRNPITSSSASSNLRRYFWYNQPLGESVHKQAAVVVDHLQTSSLFFTYDFWEYLSFLKELLIKNFPQQGHLAIIFLQIWEEQQQFGCRTMEEKDRSPAGGWLPLWCNLKSCRLYSKKKKNQRQFDSFFCLNFLNTTVRMYVDRVDPDSWWVTAGFSRVRQILLSCLGFC